MFKCLLLIKLRLKRSERNACTRTTNIKYSVVNKASKPSLGEKKNNKTILLSIEVSNRALKTMHLREEILPFEMDSAVVC